MSTKVNGRYLPCSYWEKNKWNKNKCLLTFGAKVGPKIQSTQQFARKRPKQSKHRYWLRKPPKNNKVVFDFASVDRPPLGNQQCQMHLGCQMQTCITYHTIKKNHNNTLPYLTSHVISLHDYIRIHYCRYIILHTHIYIYTYLVHLISLHRIPFHAHHNSRSA